MSKKQRSDQSKRMSAKSWRREKSSEEGAVREASSPRKHFSFWWCIPLFSFGQVGLINLHTYFVYQTYQQGACTIEGETIQTKPQKGNENYSFPRFTYTVRTKSGQQAQIIDGYDGGPSDDQQRFLTQDEAQQVINGYQVGQSYSCWYNPGNPSHAVLVLNDYSLTNLLIYDAWMVFCCFIYLGCLGVPSVIWICFRRIGRIIAVVLFLFLLLYGIGWVYNVWTSV